MDRARRGEGVTLIELMTFRRKGHAEHDNQSYVLPGEVERWAKQNDPIVRYMRVLRDVLHATDDELAAIDARILHEIDVAADLAELSVPPEALDALVGVYANPTSEQPLWFRRDAADIRYGDERAQGWGTWDVDAGAK